MYCHSEWGFTVFIYRHIGDDLLRGEHSLFKIIDIVLINVTYYISTLQSGRIQHTGRDRRSLRNIEKDPSRVLQLLCALVFLAINVGEIEIMHTLSTPIYIYIHMVNKCRYVNDL